MNTSVNTSVSIYDFPRRLTYGQFVSAAEATITALVSRADGDERRAFGVRVCADGGDTAAVSRVGNLFQVRLPSLSADRIVAGGYARRLLAFVVHEAAHAAYSDLDVWAERRLEPAAALLVNAAEDYFVEALTVNGTGLAGAAGALLGGLNDAALAPSAAAAVANARDPVAQGRALLLASLNRHGRQVAPAMDAACAAAWQAADPRVAAGVRELLDTLDAACDEACRAQRPAWTARGGQADRIDAALALFDRLSALGPLDAGQSDAGQSDAGQSDAGQSEAGQSDAGQSDAGQSEAGQSDAGQSDAGQSEAGQSDAGQSDAGQSEAGQSDAGQSGAGQPGSGAGEGAGRPEDGADFAAAARRAALLEFGIRPDPDEANAAMRVPVGEVKPLPPDEVAAAVSGFCAADHGGATVELVSLLPLRPLFAACRQGLAAPDTIRPARRLLSGRLDRRALWRASRGAPDVFTRRDWAPAVRTGVLLALDLSSSMNEKAALRLPTGQRVDTARIRATVAVASALLTAGSRAGADVAVYGFSLAGGQLGRGSYREDYVSHTVLPLADWSERFPDPRAFAVRYGRLVGAGGTPMAREARMFTNLLLARRNLTRRVVLWICDGCGGEGVGAVSAAIEAQRRRGVEHVAVGLDAPMVRAVFGDHASAVVEDLDELPAAVQRLLLPGVAG